MWKRRQRIRWEIKVMCCHGTYEKQFVGNLGSSRFIEVIDGCG